MSDSRGINASLSGYDRLRHIHNDHIQRTCMLPPRESIVELHVIPDDGPANVIIKAVYQDKSGTMNEATVHNSRSHLMSAFTDEPGIPTAWIETYDIYRQQAILDAIQDQHGLRLGFDEVDIIDYAEDKTLGRDIVIKAKTDSVRWYGQVKINVLPKFRQLSSDIEDSFDKYEKEVPVSYESYVADPINALRLATSMQYGYRIAPDAISFDMYGMPQYPEQGWYGWVSVVGNSSAGYRGNDQVFIRISTPPISEA